MQAKNTLGITGICLGFFIPFVGIILGILSLAKKEKSIAVGIISIIVGAFGWILGLFLLTIVFGFLFGIVR